MDTIIQCCPVCGKLLSYRSIRCFDCGYSKSLSKKQRKELQTKYNQNEIAHIPVNLYNSLNSKEYYEELSMLQFNDTLHWKQIFVEQELSKNPLFDYEKYKNSCQKEKGIEQYKTDFQKQEKQNKTNNNLSQPTQSNVPRCPTCGSTKIKRISALNRAAHGYAFGLFSKTARSQFECKNCGMKF